jgi:hypothetical protein
MPFDLIRNVWNWLTQQAFNQLIALFLVAILSFLILLKYPIEFERTTYTVKDQIHVTKTAQYIVRSSMTDKGAKLQLCTQTYYVEVNK